MDDNHLGTVPVEQYSEAELDTIENFILTHFGMYENVIHEISSTDIHVDICIIPPTEERYYFTLVTMGMGAHRMKVPGEMPKGRLERAELLLCLPPDWKLLQEEERWYWPLRWMKIAARLPVEEDSWLGWGHTLGDGEPFADNTKLSTLMLVTPFAFGSEAESCTMPDGEEINFYQLVPLYPEELEFKAEYGAENLLQRMGTKAQQVVDITRKNVCPEGAATVLDDADDDSDLLPTFRERADEFWEWFVANERTLTDMTFQPEKYSSQMIEDFLSAGADLISEEIHLSANGPRELTFTAGGEVYLFYLLPWLTKRMPKQLQGYWRVLPFLPGRQCGRADFGLYGVRLDVDDVLVSAVYDETENQFELRFFGEQLCSLEEDQCYSAFYLLLENCVGEGFLQIYIYDVKKESCPQANMMPLCGLGAHMRNRIRAAGKTVLERPDQNYRAYEEGVRNPEGLRDDIYSGTTCFSELLDDYHAEEQEIADAIEEFGAKAVFLTFPCGSLKQKELLIMCGELESQIEKQVLGERDSGNEIGILLGNAVGTKYVYIDILVYDAPSFFRRLRGLLGQYHQQFTLNEFHRGSGTRSF